jgi:DNA-binding NtrC family response regulator
VHEFETTYLAALLERAGGNVSAAARLAQMDRSHLIDLLRRHDLRGK